jgi:lactoylglutathione lyase
MKPYSVTGFYHAGITVKNLQRSIEFYCDHLGFELISQQENSDDYVFNLVSVREAKSIKIAFLKLPGDPMMIELLEYVGVERHSGSSRPCDYGTGHICVYVNDLDSMYQELLKKDVSFRSDSPVYVTSGRNKGSKIIYCTDPDGFIIELVEAADSSLYREK